MAKIQLVIAELDAKYLDLLLNFIRTTDYNNKFTVRSFSQPDSFKEYLKNPIDTDILLINEVFKAADFSKLDNSKILILTDQLSPQHSLDQINKFQPLNQLLNEVLSFFYDKGEMEFNPLIGNKRTTTVAVYSATGFCGKTTLALNLSNTLAEQGKKVFYLNLEYLNSPIIYDADNDNEFSKLLYHLKSKTADQVGVQFEILKKHQQKFNFDYMPVAKVPQEIIDMSREDSNKLIEIILENGQYDYLVIDLESSIHARIFGALEKSDIIYWLLLDDINCLYKTNLLKEEMKLVYGNSYSGIEKRIKHILNKSLNQQFNTISDYGININAILPYIPEWKAINNNQQLYSSIEFKKAIRNLIGDI